MKPIAAIILAAGSSRRMGNDFKPLLPLGDRTVLEHVIQTHRSAGIRDIRVVSGHRAGELQPIAEKHQARIIENPHYPKGMFSSVKTGIHSLDKETDGFFIHPADIPLVRPATIRKLAAVFQDETDGILFPVFNGQQGHPPLISRRHIKTILAWEGPQGLQGALSGIPRQGNVLVPDQGILCDMDTPEEYQWMARRVSDLDIPTQTECAMAMESIFAVSKQIQKHGMAVAKMALVFAAALCERGCGLNKHLVIASALLHDAARGKPHHAKIGADQLRQMGFDRVADIVAAHMDYALRDPHSINEAAVVFLADKVIQEDRPVNLAGRFNDKLEKYAHDPQAVAMIRQRQNLALAVKSAMEKVIGMTIEALIDQKQAPLEKDGFVDDIPDAAW